MVMRYLISDYKICDFGDEQSGVKGCLVILHVLVVMRYEILVMIKVVWL